MTLPSILKSWLPRQGQKFRASADIDKVTFLDFLEAMGDGLFEELFFLISINDERQSFSDDFARIVGESGIDFFAGQEPSWTVGRAASRDCAKPITLTIQESSIF